MKKKDTKTKLTKHRLHATSDYHITKKMKKKDTKTKLIKHRLHATSECHQPGMGECVLAKQ